MSDSVLVIGGGIAGCRAALDLAHAGAHVVLVENTATLGGKMAAILEKGAPVLDLPSASKLPSIAAVAEHANIEVFTLTDVIGFSGEAGDFTVTLCQHQRFVNDNCDLCGACRQVCPVVCPNEYDAGLTFRKAIFQPLRNSVPNTCVVDVTTCLNEPPNYLPCQRCVQKCPVNAIHFDLPLSHTFSREVGSVILTTGFDLVEVTGLEPYGYGSHPDILTSMELERLFAVSGATGGFVAKPSNEQDPESVLIVLCDNAPFTWTYSARHAARLMDQAIENVTLLYTAPSPNTVNPGNFLKGTASDKASVIRGEVTGIRSAAGSSLTLEYADADTGGVLAQDFDMVVLASAVRPPAGLGGVAEMLGIKLGSDGFVKTMEKLAAPPLLIPAEMPVEQTRSHGGVRVLTTRPGIYAAGCVSGPKNIAASISQASASADQALYHLGPRLRQAANGEYKGGTGSNGSGNNGSNGSRRLIPAPAAVSTATVDTAKAPEQSPGTTVRLQDK